MNGLRAILTFVLLLTVAAAPAQRTEMASEPDSVEVRKPLPAEKKQVSLAGYVYMDNRDAIRADGLVYSEVVNGAVVGLCMAADTLYTTTDAQGGFLFRRVPAGDAVITVEHLSIEPYSKRITIDPKNPNVFLTVQERSVEIDKVEVEGRVPVYVMSGDTIKYNVAATQKLAEGDMAGDVMSRLPGVTVGDGGFKVLGKSVDKAYVDSRLIFGDNPMNALQYLAASDIISIKVYDQPTIGERLSNVKTGETERVIDIETRSKLKFAVAGHALASYGRNFETLGDVTDNRYGGGVTANYFSEMTQVMGNGYYNNLNRTSNELKNTVSINNISPEYNQTGYAGIQAVRKFGDPELGRSLSMSYSYGNDKGRSENDTEQSYVPDGDYLLREYNSSVRARTKRDAHNVRVDWRSFDVKWLPSLSFDFSRSTSGYEKFSDMKQLFQPASGDDMVSESVAQRAVDDGESYKYGVMVSKSINLGKNASVWVQASGNFGSDTGSSIQRDSTASTGVAETYLTDAIGRYRSANAMMNLHIKTGDKTSLTVRYDFNYNYSRRRQLRYADAIAEANLDAPTSSNYTDNSLTHRPGVSLLYDQQRLNIGLDLSIATQRQDRTLPTDLRLRKNYMALLPSVMWTICKKMHSRTFLMLITNAMMPSVEQLNTRLDTSNPLFVSSGNPDLRQSRLYSMMLSGQYMLGKGHMLELLANASMTVNGIVSRSELYVEGGTIDGYDYQMMPGATYTTYSNVNGTVNADVKVGYWCNINPLKLAFRTSVKYEFSRTPSYIDGVLNYALTHRPSVLVSFKSNFSRNIRFSIQTNTRYSNVRNSRYENVEYLDQSVQVTSSNDFAKRFFINISYLYSLRYPLHNLSNRIETHSLNAVAGVRFLRGNRASLSIACYDILNSASAFKTSVAQNYTLTTFSPTFSRYWVIDFSFRFNTTEGRRGSTVSTSGRSMNTGSRFENRSYMVY